MDGIDPACWDHVVPFEARFLEALQVRKVSDPSEFQDAVSKIFDRIDSNGDGCIDRGDLEDLMRNSIYTSCPPRVWAITPDQLLEKIGATGPRVSRAEFIAAVEKIADTLDRRVWPVATSQFFSALMFAISAPLMPLLVKELGISMAHFGGMVALMPLIRIALAFPSTFLANKYGRKPMTVQGQLVAAVGFGLSAFITSPTQLIACRAIIGAGTNFSMVGQQNMLGDIATGRTRSRVFAPGAMSASAAYAIGPVIGGWLAASVGVQSVYVLVAAGMAGVSLRNKYILTETLGLPAKRVDVSPTVGMQTVALVWEEWARTARLFARDPALRAVTFASVGLNFSSISSKFVLLPMLALDTWGLDAAQLGVAMGAMALLQVAAARPAAYVADVYGRPAALLPGLALTTSAMAAAASGLPVEAALPLVCSAWALGTSLVGSVPSALVLDAAANCRMDQESTTRALTISRVLGDLGMVAGCVTSGVLLGGFGAPAAFGVQAGILAAVNATTAGALRRR